MNDGGDMSSRMVNVEDREKNILQYEREKPSRQMVAQQRLSL